MAKCTDCGVPAGFMMSLCKACIDKSTRNAGNPSACTSVAAPNVTPYVAESSLIPTQGSYKICMIAGALFLLIGLYYLFNPTLPEPDAYTRSLISNVVNLQRLAIGQTFTLVGAIFLAIGIRPR